MDNRIVLILIRKKLVIFFLMIFVVSGCALTTAIKKNNKKISNLDVGQSIKEILDEMGSPDKNEKYVLGEQETAIWFYKVSPGLDRTGRDNDLMPLVFENGKLIGWGRDIYNQTVNNLKY